MRSAKGLEYADWIWIEECPVRPNWASGSSLLNDVFLFTTAALAPKGIVKGPAVEDGEYGLLWHCYAISGRPTSFSPKTPPSSAAVVEITCFFPISTSLPACLAERLVI